MTIQILSRRVLGPVWFLTAFSLMASIAPLRAAAPETSRPIFADPDSPGSPFLLRRTEARITVSGSVAHAVVTQAWENPNTFPVDGLYVFPLPENAAVTDMQLKIGERVVRGEMRRREEARALYDQARREGRVAGLLDQERPNVFAQQIANIMPGARIDVVLSFDHEIKCEDGACEYVLPTVVGPRFVPWRQGDPGRINPPVVEQGRSTGQTLSLSLDLDAGVSVHDLMSPSHRITLTHRGESRASVALTEGTGAGLDRDFRLRWRVGNEGPEVGLLAWRDPVERNEPGVFTLIVQPPADPRDEEVAPRELVFVIDCSGSMRGAPLEAAKGVVRQALRALGPRDTFQIIRFSERASGLGPNPLPPTPEHVRRGLAYLDGLQGEGGTEMISGIRAALGYPADAERVRIVAFLTDGYIGNESEILDEVRRLIGAARLFSFGIGTSVNRHLLEGLAEEGRGAAAFLAPRESPDEMVERFVRRIAAPLLTDIRITWEDLEVEDLEPARIPDLFAGQPLLIHGRYRKAGTGLVIVEGEQGGRRRTYRRVVILPDRAADHEAVGRLWARARIHRLSRELHGGEDDATRERIIALGLRHRLMTAWTSLVAIDSVISNTSGSSTPMEVPVNLPEDVSYEGIFGSSAVRQAAVMSSPASGGLGRLTGVWRLESPGPPQAKSVPGLAAPSRETDARALDRPSDFVRLILFRQDGAQIVIEEDGEVWSVGPRSRSLIKTLAAPDMETLRRALAAARPEGWTGADSGARIVLESAGHRRILALPSQDPAVQALIRLIERGSAR